MTIDVLRNRIEQQSLKVFGFNPKDRSLYERYIKDLPHDWLIYPNPCVPQGSLEEANLNDPDLKQFIFQMILPRTGFLLGQKF